jgi:hypothetical protein
VLSRLLYRGLGRDKTMGYCVIPDLTTGKYMCLAPCQHRDCAAVKRDFIEHGKCVICGKPLENGDKFYYVGDTQNEKTKYDKAHMFCEIERIEKERKQNK